MSPYSHDISGREYARLGDLKAGDTILLDGGFTCMRPGKHIVFADDNGQLRVQCDEGWHYLGGQLDDTGHLIGVYKP